MHEQSTRAEIDRWSFTNEYHFGNFRGDFMEMMRRGYDVHVHYTNFGLRRIYFRIPYGFEHADQPHHLLSGRGGRAVRAAHRAPCDRGRINPYVTSRGAWKTLDTYRNVVAVSAHAPR